MPRDLHRANRNRRRYRYHVCISFSVTDNQGRITATEPYAKFQTFSSKKLASFALAGLMPVIAAGRGIELNQIVHKAWLEKEEYIPEPRRQFEPGLSAEQIWKMQEEAMYRRLLGK